MEQLLKLRKATLEHLSIHEYNLTYLDYVLNFLNKDIAFDSFDIKKSILMTYIKLKSIPRTLAEVNDVLGYRIKTSSRHGERKYTSTDISDLLENNYHKDMSEEYKEILQVAKILYWYLGQASYGRLCVADTKINEDWILLK